MKQVLDYNTFISEKLDIKPVTKNELASIKNDASSDIKPLLDNINKKIYETIKRFEQTETTYSERCSATYSVVYLDPNYGTHFLNIFYKTLEKVDEIKLVEKIAKYCALHIADFEKAFPCIRFAINYENSKNINNFYVCKKVRGKLYVKETDIIL